MSLSPAIIEAMLAAGASAEVLAAAMKADIAEREAVDAGRRAKGAERTRRSRERNVMSHDVTLQDVTQRDVTETPTLSRPPNENNSNPPTHTHPDIHTPRARAADPFPILDCTDPQTWADFLRNRKAKRLPCTATAHAKLLADLDKWAARTGWPPGEVFSACVAKGWGAIYDPTEDDHGRNQQQRPKANGANHATPNGRPMGRTEAAARAVAARMAGPGEPRGNSPELVALPDLVRPNWNVG